jgi:hypothetical protein
MRQSQSQAESLDRDKTWYQKALIEKSGDRLLNSPAEEQIAYGVPGIPRNLAACSSARLMAGWKTCPT